MRSRRSAERSRASGRWVGSGPAGAGRATTRTLGDRTLRSPRARAAPRPDALTPSGVQPDPMGTRRGGRPTRGADDAGRGPGPSGRTHARLLATARSAQSCRLRSMSQARKLKIRVLIADDHQLILDGVRHALEDSGEFEVVGEAMNGNQVLALRSAPSPTWSCSTSACREWTDWSASTRSRSAARRSR